MLYTIHRTLPKITKNMTHKNKPQRLIHACIGSILGILLVALMYQNLHGILEKTFHSFAALSNFATIERFIGNSAVENMYPNQVFVDSNGKYFIADTTNNRVLIYNTEPTSPSSYPDVIVGDTDMGLESDSTKVVSASTLTLPKSVYSDGTKMYVADTGNNRVLIWNSIPTGNNTTADVVLGQTIFTTNNTIATGATSINSPNGVIVEGSQLLVADNIGRVLIWNTIPTASNTAANLVIGAAGLTSTPTGASTATTFIPTSISSQAGRLFITDGSHHRVLVYNTIPVANGAAADLVFGQTTLTGSTQGTTATTLKTPSFAQYDGTKLYIADQGNHRVLIWNTPSFVAATNGQTANVVLGQSLFTTGTAPAVPTATSLFSPNFLFSTGTKLFIPQGIGSFSMNRVSIFNTIPTGNNTAADTLLGKATLTATAYSNYSPQSGLLSINGFLDNAGHIYMYSNNQDCRVQMYDSIPVTATAGANRILGFGSTDLLNTTPAGPTQSLLQGCFGQVGAVTSDGTRVAITDASANRIMLWNTPPTTTGQNADVLITGFTQLRGLSMAGNKLAVVDGNTIKIWFTIPTANTSTADLTIVPTGNFAFSNARSVSIQNNQLMATDSVRNRVLIWNAIPTTASQAPDLVLGQANFINSGAAQTQSGLSAPEDVFFDGQRIFVSDKGNNRVLVWSSVVTTNGQNADYVLGSSSFTAASSFDPSKSLLSPSQLSYANGKLMVTSKNYGKIIDVGTPSYPSAPTTVFINTQANGAQSGVSDPTGITTNSLAISAIHQHADTINANKYQVLVSKFPDFATSVLDSGITGTAMTSTPTGSRSPDLLIAPTLTANTTYYLKTRFFDTNGSRGLFSGVQSFVYNTAANLPIFTSLDKRTGTSYDLIKSVKGNDDFARIVSFTRSGIKYTQCTNAPCSTSISNIIEAASSLTVKADIKISPTDGFPRIGYYTSNGITSQLKYVTCTDDACSTPTIKVVDTPSMNSNLSMAIGTDGNARFLYNNNTTNTVRFARCTNSTCDSNISTPVITTIETTSSSIQMNLLLGNDQFGRIAYNSGSGAIKYVQCSNNDCSSPVLQSIIAVGNGAQVSFTLASDDTGRIVHTTSPGALNYITCTNSACSASSSIQIHPATSFVSQQTYSGLSLERGTDGLPRVIYTDTTQGNIKMITCTNNTCSEHFYNTIDTVVGSPTSLYFGNDTFPRISYVDTTNGYYKFAQCQTATCSTNAAPTAPTTPFANTITNGAQTGLPNPTGLTSPTVQFSAIHNDPENDPAVKYQIQIATDNTFSTMVFDSGAAGTAITAFNSATRSVNISTTASLSPSSTYYWKIKFWDAAGNEGAYSATATFQTTAQYNANLLTVPNTSFATTATNVFSSTLGTDGFMRTASMVMNVTTSFKLTRCLDIDCSQSTVTTIAAPWFNASNAQLSMVLDASNKPLITYSSSPSNALKLLNCTNQDCTSFTSATLDTDGTSPRMILGADGFPRIAYYTLGNIKYIRCTLSATCATRTTQIITAAGTSPEDLQIGSDNLARILSVDTTQAPFRFKLSVCTTDDCSAHNDTFIAGTNISYGASLLLNSSDLPRIVYNNGSELNYVECTTTSCSTNVSTLLDAQMSPGSNSNYPGFFMDPDGFARISYSGGSRASSGLSFIKCTNTSCTQRTKTVVDNTNATEHNILLYTPTPPPEGGNYRIAYRNTTAQTLKYARCFDSTCGAILVNNAPSAPTTPFSNTFIATAQTGTTNPTNLQSASMVFSAKYADTDTGDAATKYRLQVSTDNTFTGLIYDSGAAGTNLNASILATVGGNRSADLVADIKPMEGQTLYWRIKFFDVGGQEGAFSTANSFSIGTNIPASLTNIPTVSGASSVQSSAVASDGFSRIVYLDSSTQKLIYTQCKNADCASYAQKQIDTVNIATPTILIGSDNLPVIVYQDVTSSDLKVAHCNDDACSVPLIRTLASTGATGFNPSMVIGPDGFPKLVYGNSSLAQTIFVNCTDVTCDTGNVGYSTSTLVNTNSKNSLAITSSGLPRIAIIGAASLVSYVQCTNATCTSVTTTPLTGIQATDYVNMILDSGDKPFILYDFNVSGLKVYGLKCSDINCSAFSTIQMDNTANFSTPVTTSLQKGPDGFPKFVYGDGSLVLRYMACLSDSCDQRTNTSLDGSSNGNRASIAFAADTFPRMTASVNSLSTRYLRCTNTTCGTTTNIIPAAPTSLFINTQGSTAQSGQINPTGLANTNLVVSAIHHDPDGQNANKYRIQFSTSNTFATIAYDSGAAGTAITSFANNTRSTDIAVPFSFAVNTTYFWRVQFWDTNNATGDFSATAQFTTGSGSTPPTAPTSLFSNTAVTTAQAGTANPTNLQSASLAFSAIYNDADAGDTATAYRIQIASDNAFASLLYDSGVAGQPVPSTTTQGSRSPDLFVNYKVPENVSYFWRIAFIDASGSGPFSSGATFAVGSIIPGSVTPLSTTAHTPLDVLIAADGFERILYKDVNTNKLNLIQCRNSDCTSKVTTVLDAINNVTSAQIKMGADGFPIVSYVSSGLRYIHCTNADCSTQESTIISGVVSVNNLSMTLGSDNLPRMVYTINGAPAQLLMTRCTLVSCTTSVSTTISTNVNINGGGGTITMDTSGLPSISFSSLTGGFLGYIHCSDADCTTKTTVIFPFQSSSTSKILIGIENKPFILYKNTPTNSSIARILCGDILCGTYDQKSLIDTNQGYTISAALGNDGFPKIFYYSYNFTSGIYQTSYIGCTTFDCIQRTLSIIGTDFSAITTSVGPVQIDPTDTYPRMAYSNAGMKNMRCTNATCGATTNIAPDSPTNLFINSSANGAQTGSTNPTGLPNANLVVSAVHQDPDQNNATKYQIQFSTSNTFATIAYDSGASGTALTSFAYNTRSANIAVPFTFNVNSTYYWRIRFWDSNNQGAFSATAQFGVGAGTIAPLAPTSLFANTHLVTAQSGLTNPTNLTSASMVFSAIHNDTDIGDLATAYRIQIATDNAFSSIVYDTGAAGLTVPSTTAQGVRSPDLAVAFKTAENSTYYWRIAFIDTAGSGPFSSIASFSTGANLSPSITTLAEADQNGFRFMDSALGQDGYARLITDDITKSKLIYTQCKNDDCSLKSTQVLEDATGGGINYVSNAHIQMGSDGFARIAYVRSGPSATEYYRLRFIQCQSHDCSVRSTNTVRQVNSIPFTLNNYLSDTFFELAPGNEPIIINNQLVSGVYRYEYIHCSTTDCSAQQSQVLNVNVLANETVDGIKIGSNGLPRIFVSKKDTDISYRNYGQILCNDLDCSAPGAATYATDKFTGTPLAIDINASNVPTYLTGHTDIGYSAELEYYQCANALCTSGQRSIIANDVSTLAAANGMLKRGTDGFHRITYPGTTSLKTIVCTNATCSTRKSSSVNDGLTDTYTSFLDNDGFLHVGYVKYNYPATPYYQYRLARCTNNYCGANSNMGPNVPGTLYLNTQTNGAQAGSTLPTTINSMNLAVSAVYSDPEGDAAQSYRLRIFNSSNGAIFDTGTVALTGITDGMRIPDILISPTLTNNATYSAVLTFTDVNGKVGIDTPFYNIYYSPFTFTTNQSPTAPTTLYTNKLATGAQAGLTNPTLDSTTDIVFSAVHNDPETDAATKYRLQISTSNTFATTLYDSGAAGTSMTSLTSGARSTDFAPGLTYTDGTTYYWRIKFWDTNNLEGVYSSTNQFTISSNQAPTSPTTLFSNTVAATAQSGLNNPLTLLDSTIAFSAIHNDPEADASTKYQLQIATSSNFAGLVYDSGATGTTMTSTANGARSPDIVPVTSLTPGTLYYWRIRFWDINDHVGAFSPTGGGAAKFQIKRGPIAPNGLFSNTQAATAQAGFTNPTLNSQNVSFSALHHDVDSDNATKYRLQISTDNTFATTFYDSGAAGTAMTSTADNTRIADITPSLSYTDYTTYYWRIKFWDTDTMEGDYSATAQFTLQINPAPTAPTVLYANAVATGAQSGDVSPTLTTTRVAFSGIYHDALGEAANKYELQISSNAGFTGIIYDSGATGTSMATLADGARLPDLAPTVAYSNNTTYYWRLRFWDETDHTGAFSAANTFRIEANTPATDLFANEPAFGAQTGQTNPVSLNSTNVTFSALYHDVEGDAATKYRLQIASDAAFTALEYDSGAAGTAMSVNDNARSANITPANIFINGNTYYWRIQFWDSTDLLHNFSSTNTFTIGLNEAPTAPTVLYTNDAATGAQLGLVNPTTLGSQALVFSALFQDPNTNETAQSYQLLIATDNAFTTTVYDSGKTTLSTPVARNTRTPNIGVGAFLPNIGTTYFWKIKFWDHLDTEGVYSASATFSPPDLLPPAFDGASVPVHLSTNNDITSNIEIRYADVISPLSLTSLQATLGVTPVVVNGVCQAGFACTITQSDPQHLLLVINPDASLAMATTYTLTTSIRDQAAASNLFTSNIRFTTQAAPDAPSGLYANVGSTGAQSGDVNPNTLNSATLTVSAVHNDTGNLPADKYQLEISSDSDFTTILYDSGALGTSLAAPLANGTRSENITIPYTFVDNTSYFWRIRYFTSLVPSSYASAYFHTSFNQTPTTPIDVYANISTDGAQAGEVNPENLTSNNVVFSAVFTDPDGTDTASKYRLQVATDSSFTSLVYDNGLGGSILASLKEMTPKTLLASVGRTLPSPLATVLLAVAPSTGNRTENISLPFTTLSYDTTYYWRIKFWDGVGVEGPFSATAHFRSPDTVIPRLGTTSPLPFSNNAPLRPTITLPLTDDETGINPASINVSVAGVPAITNGNCEPRFSCQSANISNGVHVTVTPAFDLAYGTNTTVDLNVTDNAVALNKLTNSFTFTTLPVPTYLGGGGGSSEGTITDGGNTNTPLHGAANSNVPQGSNDTNHIITNTSASQNANTPTPGEVIPMINENTNVPLQTNGNVSITPVGNTNSSSTNSTAGNLIPAVPAQNVPGFPASAFAVTGGEVNTTLARAPLCNTVGSLTFCSADATDTQAPGTSICAASVKDITSTSTSNGLHLTWTPSISGNVGGYLVTVSNMGKKTSIFTLDKNATGAYINGLAPDTSYVVDIATVNTSGHVCPESMAKGTFTTLPGIMRVANEACIQAAGSSQTQCLPFLDEPKKDNTCPASIHDLTGIPTKYTISLRWVPSTTPTVANQIMYITKAGVRSPGIILGSYPDRAILYKLLKGTTYTIRIEAISPDGSACPESAVEKDITTLDDSEDFNVINNNLNISAHNKNVSNLFGESSDACYFELSTFGSSSSEFQDCITAYNLYSISGKKYGSTGDDICFMEGKTLYCGRKGGLYTQVEKVVGPEGNTYYSSLKGANGTNNNINVLIDEGDTNAANPTNAAIAALRRSIAKIFNKPIPLDGVTHITHTEIINNQFIDITNENAVNMAGLSKSCATLLGSMGVSTTGATTTCSKLLTGGTITPDEILPTTPSRRCIDQGDITLCEITPDELLAALDVSIPGDTFISDFTPGTPGSTTINVFRRKGKSNICTPENTNAQPQTIVDTQSFPNFMDIPQPDKDVCMEVTPGYSFCARFPVAPLHIELEPTIITTTTVITPGDTCTPATTITNSTQNNINGEVLSEQAKFMEVLTERAGSFCPVNGYDLSIPAANRDRDLDGLPDSMDPDIDNDGIPNTQDDFPFDSLYSKDIDQDCVPDPIDNCPTIPNPDQLDSLHNGIGDACRTSQTKLKSSAPEQCKLVTTPTISAEVQILDSFLNPDITLLRIGALSESTTVQESISPTVPENITTTSLLPTTSIDTDNNGLSDTWEILYFQKTGMDPNADDDHDGLTNNEEAKLGTNPTEADTDHDGLSDYDEVYLHHTNPRKWDTDGDGLSDGDEIKRYHTDPLLVDTDGDGFMDGSEVLASGTDPNDKSAHPEDLDGDGIDDTWVRKYFPNDIDENGLFKVMDGITLGTRDSDKDGLSDALEYYYGTNPLIADTDGDGYSDGEEVLDMATDPLVPNDHSQHTLMSFTNLQSGDISTSPTMLIKGISDYPNSLVSIYMQPTGSKELFFLGSVMTDEGGKFLLVTPHIENGSYTIYAVAKDKDGKLLQETSGISVIVDKSVELPAPLASHLDGQNIQNVTSGSDPISISTAQPAVQGQTLFNSQVTATFRSNIFSSSLIADTPQASFSLTAPKPLEFGNHKLYLTATNKALHLKSNSTVIPFERVQTTGIHGSAEQPFSIPWAYIGCGLGTITLIFFFWRRRKNKMQVVEHSI